MPAIQVDPGKVKTFKTAEAFYAWLAKNHVKEKELWIKIHKAGSGLKSITPKEAIDVVLCWGWIDGVRKSLDDTSFLQRYSPRGAQHLESDQCRQRRASHSRRSDDRSGTQRSGSRKG